MYPNAVLRQVVPTQVVYTSMPFVFDGQHERWVARPRFASAQGGFRGMDNFE